MEEEVLGKAYDGRLMRRLLTYIRPYKTELAIALALLTINAVLQAVGPLLTQFAVDTRYPGENASKRQAEAALRWAGRVRTKARAILGIRPRR